MPTVQIERRRRGIFGWLVALLFWAWQALMVWWFLDTSHMAVNYTARLSSAAERTGANLGIGVSIVVILLVWALGTVILGTMMMFTRGRRELITVERA